MKAARKALKRVDEVAQLEERMPQMTAKLKASRALTGSSTCSVCFASNEVSFSIQARDAKVKLEVKATTAASTGKGKKKQDKASTATSISEKKKKQVSRPAASCHAGLLMNLSWSHLLRFC